MPTDRVVDVPVPLPVSVRERDREHAPGQPPPAPSVECGLPGSQTALSRWLLALAPLIAGVDLVVAHEQTAGLVVGAVMIGAVLIGLAFFLTGPMHGVDRRSHRQKN